MAEAPATKNPATDNNVNQKVNETNVIKLMNLLVEQEKVKCSDLTEESILAFRRLEKDGFAEIGEEIIKPTSKCIEVVQTTEERAEEYHEPKEESHPWYSYEKNKKGEITGIDFRPGLLGEYITEKEHILTFTDTMEPYIYKEGVYVAAEPLINHIIQKKTPVDYFKKFYKTETMDYIKTDTITDRREIEENSNKNLVNLKNGLLDITTFELSEHTPEHISFSQIITLWNPEAQCPKFLKILEEALPQEDDRKTLQEFAGTILLQDMRYQKVLVLFGEGGNGKTTILNILMGVIGKENIATETKQTLANNR